MIGRALVIAAILAGAVPAIAQDGAWYRPGSPEVLVPSPSGFDSVGTAFANAYRGQGRPRVTVLWMRSPSDRGVYERRTVDRIEDTVVVGRAAISGIEGAPVVDVVSAHRVLHREETTGVYAEPSQNPLTPAASRAAEAAFLQALIRAGTRIADHAAVNRRSTDVTAAAHAADAAARTTSADLLVEVMATPDGTAAGRLSYRVDVRTMPGDTLLVSFVTAADPRPGTDAAFTTAPGRGYVEVPGPALGQELAWQTMERITEAWRR